jgi:hypothetical protein
VICSTPPDLEVGDDGPDPAVVVTGFGQVQFRQDAADVFFDGALCDPQPAGDTCVRPALGHQHHHLLLARAEHRQRVVAPASRDQLLNECGVDHRCAFGDAFERVNEIGEHQASNSVASAACPTTSIPDRSSRLASPSHSTTSEGMAYRSGFEDIVTRVRLAVLTCPRGERMAVARATELLASGRAIAYMLKSRVTEPTVDSSRTDARGRPQM